MNTLLQKLDRQAGCWLESLDRGLQQPIFRAITGQVFVDTASPNRHQQPDTAQFAKPHSAQPCELSVCKSSIPAELDQQRCGNAA